MSAAAFSLLIAPALADPPPPALRPESTIGDTFEYAGTFVTVPCARWTVTQVDQNGYDVSTCGDDTAYFRASTASLVRIVGPRGVLVQFTPASPSLEFPLALGRKWAARYGGFTADDGARFESTESCAVSAWETVQTAAGAFQSYRIECDDDWTSGPAAGHAHQTSWYAPLARTVVKVHSNDDARWNMELKSYTLQR